MKLVYIEWEDILDSGAEWKSRSEINEWSKKHQAIAIQVGIIVKETRKYLYLTNQKIDNEFGTVTRILKSVIIVRKELVAAP